MLIIRRYLRLFLALAVFLQAVMFAQVAASEVKATYLYDLSTFTGTVPLDWSRICADTLNKDVYVARGDTIRIFNQSGMEIFRFGTYDLGASVITDMTVNSEGNLLVLSYKEGKYSVIISNYKGNPKGEITIQNLPEAFAGFSPNRMVYHGGKLYFAELQALKMVITDPEGKFVEGIDIASLINIKDDKRTENDMFAFTIGTQGEILFTIPALARAYVMGQNRTLREFGSRGSGPGKFGVPAGITADREGNIIVSDLLRSVVLIFNRDLRFLTEFGGRGLRPGQFTGPRDIAFDGTDKLYVTQLRKRGVSVFRIGDN